MPSAADVVLFTSPEAVWGEQVFNVLRPLARSLHRAPASVAAAATPPLADAALPPTTILVVATTAHEAAAMLPRVRHAHPSRPLLLVIDHADVSPALTSDQTAESLLLWPCHPAELAAQLTLLARLSAPGAQANFAADVAPPRSAPVQGTLAEARERLAATLAATDLGTWHWYPESGRIFPDANLARLFDLDFTPDGVLLDAFINRVHPEDRERINAAVLDSIERLIPFDQEYRVVRRDGALVWLHGRGRADRSPSGARFFAGVVLDVTTRRLAQNAWADAERRFRAILEATPDGFMIYEAVRDDAGEIVDFECRFANAAAERIIGLGPRVGSRLLVDQPGTRTDGLFDIYVGVTDERRVWQRDISYRHEGIDGWFRCTAVPTEDGFAVSFSDITERRRAEQRADEEHGLLETVLEACPAGIIVADVQGRIFRVNSANQRIWGPAPASETIADYQRWKGWWADGSERHGRPIAPEEWAMSRALRGEPQPFGDVIDIEPFDQPGVRRTLINHGGTVRDQKGRIIGAVVVQTDVTAWRRAEEELRRSEERFRRLCDFMPQLVWRANGQGLVEYYNNRAEDYSGIRRKPDGGWEWEPVLHPDDEAPTVAAWIRALETGEPYQAEHRLKMHDGNYRWHLSRAFSFDSPDGKRQWFGTATDIDSHKRHQDILEEKVSQRTASLQAAIADLETFSYSMAHDMRAPLRALVGFAQLLVEDYTPVLDEDGRDMLRRIASAATRMDQLIRDVLCYSKIARSDTPLSGIDLSQLLESILQTYPSLQEHGAEIRIERPLPIVAGNEAMLTQIFSNLLGNAVKFVPSGRSPRVRIFATDSPPGRVRVHVQDNGVGIAPEHHARIFQIFQRLDSAYEGTGIGLSIVQKAAERMGGSVGVESSPGRGATFWVELAKVEPSPAC